MKFPHSFIHLFRQIEIRKGPFFIAFFVIVTLTYGVLYAIDFIPEPVVEDANSSTATFEPQVVLASDTTMPDMAIETEVFFENNNNRGLSADSADNSVVISTETVSRGASVAVASSQNNTEAPQTSVVSVVSESNSTDTEPLFNGVPELPHTIIFDSLDGRRVSVLNPRSREIAALDAALLSGVVRHPDSADLKNVGNIFILGHSSYLPNVLNRNFQAFNGIQKMTWGDRIRLISDEGEYIYRVERVYEAAASEVIVPFTPGEARLTLATCDSFGSKDDRFIVEAVLIGKQAL